MCDRQMELAMFLTFWDQIGLVGLINELRLLILNVVG